MKRMFIVVLFVSFVSQALAFYNPGQGRWMSRDPIGEKGGANLYAFNVNNPVNRADPLGLSSVHISIPAMLASGWTAEQIASVTGLSLAAAGELVLAYNNAKRNRNCRWSCFAKGNVQAIGNTRGLPDNVYGFGTGTSKADACLAAKRMATQSTPRGGYPRHLRCYKCSRN